MARALQRPLAPPLEEPGRRMLAQRPAPVPTPARASGPAADWLRALERTARLDEAPRRTLASVIDAHAAAQPDAPALISESERLSFAQLAQRTRLYAAWALAEGLRPGDVVALVMPNRPEYLAAWIGLSRVGVVTALLNPQLRGESLSHCLSAAAPRRIVVDAALASETLGAAERGLAERVWLHGAGDAGRPRIDLALESLSPAADTARGPTLNDRALLIYTSGTTGLPKAANVSHRRVMSWSRWFAGLLDISPADRLYDCLPLCHSAGGVAAVGAALAGGASTVVAGKFSASRFWDDVARWECTLFQYVGDLCRYLLAAPAHPLERAHALRAVCGNGLSGEVWEAFQQRFALPRILEFYASTEGNFSLFNVEGRPGSIGRLPAFIAHRSAIEIVKFDPATGEPQRSADGHCERCGPDEAGEAIGRVSAAGAQRFEGYTDAEATDAKLLRDVFEPGDLWLRTGDLMRRDRKGFFFFVDRVGDTFRWKGENVSTAEVAAALRACPGVADACVYGVEVPGASGKAGMAAIAPGEGFDIEDIRARLTRTLPDYARPVFVRLCAELELTETFKLKKTRLAAEGWDPARIADPVYVDDRAGEAYRALTPVVAAQLRAGALRL